MISVAMATYNGSDFIIEQLDSIRRQSLLPSEIVIVDDCSTDDTVNIIKKYFEEPPGFKWRIIENTNNLGFVKTFFKAIKECENDVIVLCDQDDVWKPNKIKRINEIFISNPDILSINFDYDIVDRKGQVIRRRSLGYKCSLSKLKFDRFVNKLNYSGMSSAFRKSIIDRFDNQIIDEFPTHDWFIHAVAASLDGFYLSNEILCARRYTGHNVALDMSISKGNRNVTIADRIKFIEVFILFYEILLKFWPLFSSSSHKKLLRRKLAVNYRRKKYLEHRSIIEWILSIFLIMYYPKTKSYFGDLRYLVLKQKDVCL